MKPSLPATVGQATWVVSSNGDVVKWEPPKTVVHLSSAHQHTAMRYALAHTLRLLMEHGFKTNCIEQSTCAISLNGMGLDFDISIRRPANIAWITSSPGDNGKRRKIGEDIHGQPLYNVGPGVRFASDTIRGEYVVQIIGSKISSLMPIYVECPPDNLDPVGYVLKNILLVIASILADKGLIEKANLDTSTMLKGKLPNFMADELAALPPFLE